jgi:hypothetical protein
LRVEAVTDTKVLFLPAGIFYNEFYNDVMLEKLKEYMINYDMEELEKKVRENWFTKRQHA